MAVGVVAPGLSATVAGGMAGRGGGVAPPRVPDDGCWRDPGV